MKATVNVTELTHEELVDLFSTAFYGNEYMTATYNNHIYQKIKEDHPIDQTNHQECWEDILAHMILSGSHIWIIDTEADEAIYGTLPHLTSPDWPELLYEGQVAYKVFYKDILKGCSTEEGYKLIQDIISGEGDLYTAWNLMQIIVFGEIIYG